MESDPTHFTTKIENEIVPSMVHLNGHFLNKIKENIPSQRKLCCELSKDRLYSFKQNILYPYANVEEKNKQLAHANYTFKLHILCYTEQNGFSLLWSMIWVGCFIHVVDIDSIQGDGIVTMLYIALSIVFMFHFNFYFEQ